MKVELVIFDMDGLIFDTGRLAYEAYLRSAETYNYEMIHNVYYYLTGRTENGIIEEMKSLYGNDQDVCAWRKEMVKNKSIILEEQKRVYKKDGLLELLEYLNVKNIKFALASSSKRAIIEQYMIYEKMEGYFDCIVSGDEVKKGKPNPEIFLKACQKAEIENKNSIVLEDSLVGIQAANNARITSCLIEDNITDMRERREGIRLKKDLSSMDISISIPAYKFNSLLDVIKFIEES